MGATFFNNANDKWLASDLIHNRLNFKWYITPTLKLDVEDRNQFMYGELLRDIPGYAESFQDDQGFVKLSHNFYDMNSCVLNATIDRAYVDYTIDKLQLTFGRQRINWGQTFVWNPNDIFNTYSYLTLTMWKDPEAMPSGHSTILTQLIRQILAFKENSDRQLTAAAMYKFNKYSYDFQFLGGVMNSNDYVLGAGWAGEIAKGGFRGELSYFHRRSGFKDTTGVFVGSISYDYTFKNSLALQVEVLYNGSNNGINNIGLTIGQNNNNPLSAKNPFLSGYSYFASLSYPITPLFTCFYSRNLQS